MSRWFMPLSLLAVSWFAPGAMPAPATVHAAALHCTTSIPRPSNSGGIPEVRGISRRGTLWALLFYPPPAKAGVTEKIVLRMTGKGPIHLVGIGPDGQRITPTWGPEAHMGSSWTRPGAEWGTGWRFPTAGCWHLHARRMHASGNVWLSVVSGGRTDGG
jgi:hypothetical protein